MHHLRGITISLTLWLLISASAPLIGQLQISHALTPEQLIQDILIGPGVKVSNVQFKGKPAGLASFTNPNLPIGIAEGIIMSSGKPESAIGANKQPDISNDLLGGVDNILGRIANGKTYDASVLEFDFVPESDSVFFNYFFASDEYPEYVGTNYNDVFGFHISGPGIVSQVNIARLPGSGKPVTVNTVNHVTNAAWYVDNNPFDRMNRYIQRKADKLDQELLLNFQYDGFTTVLTAKAPVRKGETYHIRLAIADVGDGRFDSSVFLQKNSFISAPSLAAFLTSMPSVSTDIRPRPMAVQIAGNAKLDTTASNPSSPSTPQLPSNVSTPTTLVANAKSSVTLLFSFDQDDLATEEKAKLSTIAGQWKKSPRSTLVIIGHTDAVGSGAYNRALSQRRSDAVRSALLEMGVPEGHLRQQWLGEDKPVAGNTSEDGRALNRRVEIYLVPDHE